MSFYLKTLLALFLSSSLLLVGAVSGAYRAITKSVTENYSVRYTSLTTTLSDAIEKLEVGTDDTMRAALQALKYFTMGREIPSDDKLRVMQRNLGLSSIEFVRRDGKFIRSTKYKISELPSLFSFCAGYEELFTGESDFDHTPLMPSVVDRQVQKFALLPTADGRHIINIGTEVGYIGDLFRSAMVSDHNLKSLALYTPTGVPLASFTRQNDRIIEDSNSASMTATEAGLHQSPKDWIELSSPVNATAKSCCECVGKGLVSDPSGKFNYILKTRVSLGDLNGSLERIGWTLAIAAIVGLIFSFLLSYLIARKLTSKLQGIHQKTREITELKDLTVRFNSTGNDEISNIGRTMDQLLENLEINQKELVASERSQALAQMASDVAHNIRSPLVAAENALPMLIGAPEAPRSILSRAVHEIRVLTDNLKAQADFSSQPKSSMVSEKRMGAALASSRPVIKTSRPTVQHLGGLIESVVIKKKVEYQGFAGVEWQMNFAPSDQPLFAEVASGEFRIALSNVFNNAVESLPQNQGCISVSCTSNKGRVHIKVSDTGVGIPQELLETIGTRGATYGKPQGSGIGLASTKEIVESFGGQLTLQSETGRGTVVTLDLPQAPAPPWFISELTIRPNETLVILDDDASIHALWDLKLHGQDCAGFIGQVHHLYQGCELVEWVKTHQKVDSQTTYLVDYELLGEERNGLVLIESLKIQDRSILVTGRFDEPHVLQKINWLRIKMVPKALVGSLRVDLKRHAIGTRLDFPRSLEAGNRD